MFYMPKYHNLPDGRQVFLRFPDPQRHAEAVSALLEGIPAGEEAAAFLSRINADPMGLVLVAEIAGNVAGCGLLELDQPVRLQTAAAEGCRELEGLMEQALKEVAAQKGVEL